jgi:hypothetical protein
VVIKQSLPTSSPIANDPLPAPIAEKVLKTSGDPFPNARNVTPVYAFIEVRRDERTRIGFALSI